MSRYILILGGFLCGWLILDGCSKDKAQQIFNCELTEKINFQDHIKPVIDQHCAVSGCHDAQTAAKGYDFSTYEGVKEQAESGQLLCAVKWECSNMPKGGDQLADSLLQQIECWVANQTPEMPDTVLSHCDSLGITYTKDIKAIMDQSCATGGCHDAGTASGSIILETYDQVKDQALNGVCFLTSIKWESGCSTMPQGQAQLSAETIDKIDCWIENNTPEN